MNARPACVTDARTPRAIRLRRAIALRMQKRLRLPFSASVRVRRRMVRAGQSARLPPAPLSWRETGGTRVGLAGEPHALCVADCATSSLKDLQQPPMCGGASLQ